MISKIGFLTLIMILTIFAWRKENITLLGYKCHIGVHVIICFALISQHMVYMYFSFKTWKWLGTSGLHIQGLTA